MIVDERVRFLNEVRVKRLPERLSWGLKEWLAVPAVQAVLASGWLTSLVSAGRGVAGVVDTMVRIALFLALVFLNRELLARHWRAFLAAPWCSAALVVAGMILIQIVITILGDLLRPLVPEVEADGGRASLGIGLLLFVSLNPVVTALIEDFVFRHTLLVRHRFWFIAAVTVLNALVFGAVHINNFDGQRLLTLSYAGAGLVMNLVYLWTRNI